jgi:uncharacterized protein (DUF1499 family)
MKLTDNKLTNNLYGILISITLILGGCAPLTTPVNFKQLTLPERPNYYLICPADYCNVKPGEVSPVFAVSAADLFQAWQQMLAKQPRITPLYTHPEQLQYGYVVRSWLFRFPDTVQVKFISLSKQTSSLALYSRSKYGYSDLGVNRRRLQSWLQQLQQLTQPD